MNGLLLAGIAISGGLVLAWSFHRRSVRRMTPGLERLAAQTGGTIESQGPFLMPKFVCSRSGTSVEISSASTGIAGGSQRYTYAVFSGLRTGGFAFRIVPRSGRPFGDTRARGKTLHRISAGELDRALVISADDDRMMEAVLSDTVRSDLASWSTRPAGTRISDIRAYDDKLLYAVTGTLGEYQEYQLLFDTACRFGDAVRAAANRFHDASR